LRRGASLLLMALIIEYLVLPQLGGARRDLHLVANVRPWWLGLGILLEIVSVVAYAGLTRSVLAAGRRPPFWWLLRTDVTALGVSHVVPGGAATASTLRYRLLHDGGVPREDALVGATVQGVGSALVLNVMLWVALVVSIPFVGVNLLYGIAAGIGALLMVAVAVVVVGLMRNEARVVRIVLRLCGLLPRRWRAGFARGVQSAANQLRTVLADRRQLARASAWATANWLLDAGSLYVFVAAFGHQLPNADGLLVGYGLANVLSVVPVTPGGLGIVEGVLVPSLVGFGTTRGVATLAVVGWRLFNFWLPIPLSGLTYLSLRSHDWRARQGWRAWPGAIAAGVRSAVSTEVNHDDEPVHSSDLA
jgi:uncharacterized protein (TIRG00374 family)